MGHASESISTKTDAPVERPVPPKAFLSGPEAASFLALSEKQLRNWRCAGGGPAYHKVGRRVVYSVDDLKTFMAEFRKEALR